MNNRKLALERLNTLLEDDISNIKPSTFNIQKPLGIPNTLKKLSLESLKNDLIKNAGNKVFSFQHFMCKYLCLQHEVVNFIFNVTYNRNSKYKLCGVKGLESDSGADSFIKHYKKVVKMVKDGDLDDFLLPENPAAYHHVSYGKKLTKKSLAK